MESFKKSFPPDILEKLQTRTHKRNFAIGDFILREGDKGDTFFIVDEGEIEILEEDQHVGIIYKGDILGESALNGGVRNASAKALTPVIVTEISVKGLSKKQVAVLKDAIFDGVLDKLSKVNKLTALAVKQHFEDEKTKAHMGRFIIYVLILVFIYIFALQSVTILNLTIISSSVISIPILIICCVTMFSMMKQSGYPLKTYGLNLYNWKKSLIVSLVFTIPILIALVLIKWILIEFVPVFSDLPLFDLSPALNKGAPPISREMAAFFVIVYSIFVPVQEIIYRGAMQSSLQLFLTNKTTLAILVSNIPFAMIHFHLSLILVISTYFLGIFWGYMYARQKTLVGVCVSHFLVGLFAFFILGLEGVLIF